MQDGSNTNAGRDALERRAEARPTDGAAEWSEAPLAEIERPKERSRGVRLVLLAARLIFMALILSMPVLVVASARRGEINWVTIFGLMLASGALGLVVVVIDSMTPNKRLASIFGIYLGLCLGLVGAFAVGSLLDSFAEGWNLKDTSVGLYINVARITIGCILCYVAVSVVMTTKDDFRLVIPYVEFAKQNRGVRPMLLDTSAIIDGRIVDLATSGMLDAPFLVNQAVIDELHALADSGDKGRRARGRRGLDIISRLQAAPQADLSIDGATIGGPTVDRGLVEHARRHGYRLVTTDSALAKVGAIAGIAVINLNEIASRLRSQSLPGDRLEIEIARVGENPSQGVGYLVDGTMVVIEGAGDKVGSPVAAIVTNSLPTSAGRMVFARLVRPDELEPGSLASMAARATRQPKHREGAPNQHDDDRPDARGGSSRNPRRS